MTQSPPAVLAVPAAVPVQRTSPDSATPAPKRQSRLLILDGLRLAAALFVLLWHYGFLWHTAWGAQSPEHFGPVLAGVARYGWLGVHLFFLISGFVICMSSWGRTLGEFAISRIVRLYPAYVIAVVVTAAVVTLVPHHPNRLSAVGILSNLTMLQELLGKDHLDPSYWTLAVELQFYLLFAVVVWRGVTYRRVVAFCALWLLASVTLPALHVPTLEMIFATRWAPYFVAGIAIYLVHRFGPSLLMFAIIGLCWILGVTHISYSSILTRTSAGHHDRLTSALIITAFFAIMIAVALGAFNWVRWRGWVTVGSLTYPLYLFHQVIGLTVIRAVSASVPHWVLLGALTAAMLVLAWLVHRLWERPVARWLRTGLQASLAKIRSA